MANIPRLDALNDMLASVNVRPAPAVDETGSWPTFTYGSSDVGRAGRVLDRVTREVICTSEFQVNTIKNYSIATNGSNELDFTSVKAIWIKPKGALEGQNIGLTFDSTGANPKAYNFNTGTATFSAGTYLFEVRYDKSFSELTPDAQAIIVARAVERFQQENVGNQIKDAFIQRRKAEAEPFNTSRRPPAFPPNQPLNAPIMPAQQG